MNSVVRARVQVNSLVRSAAAVVGGVAALTLLSQVTIPLPFTPVPLSLGTLGAMLLGVFLGSKRGVAAAALYAVLGMVGAPVFAGWSSGVMIVSFGYVLGYVAAAGLMGLWMERARHGGYFSALGATLGSSVIIYLFGLGWMMGMFAMPLEQALALGVVPFLVGDALKSLVIAGTARALKGRRIPW
ncbi:biotin transporter BioY [Scrofimicrobium sp. R131]|uniref:Biotin transporter n=1 Tax=Scrofimicrobium appendicitidis TaxID=3079930 RepID=A0AAU7V8S3_9ACTO